MARTDQSEGGYKFPPLWFSGTEWAVAVSLRLRRCHWQLCSRAPCIELTFSRARSFSMYLLSWLVPRPVLPKITHIIILISLIRLSKAYLANTIVRSFWYSDSFEVSRHPLFDRNYIYRRQSTLLFFYFTEGNTASARSDVCTIYRVAAAYFQTSCAAVPHKFVIIIRPGWWTVPTTVFERKRSNWRRYIFALNLCLRTQSREFQRSSEIFKCEFLIFLYFSFFRTLMIKFDVLLIRIKLRSNFI